MDIEFYIVEDELAPTSEGMNLSNSKSNTLLNDIVPPLSESQELRESQRGRIPRHFHVIEGETCMVAA